MICQFCKKDLSDAVKLLCGDDLLELEILRLVHWKAHAKTLLTEIECRINAKQPIHDTDLAKDIIEFVIRAV